MVRSGLETKDCAILGTSTTVLINTGTKYNVHVTSLFLFQSLSNNICLPLHARYSSIKVMMDSVILATSVAMPSQIVNSYN